MKYAYIYLFFIGFSISGVAQLRVPAPSPTAEVRQTVGLTDIHISYSRPSVRGRSIFGAGGLLPYGELWRTGANTATKITFSDEVTLGGATFETGSYTVLSKPEKNVWALHFYPYESGDWTTYINKTPIQTLTTKVSNLETKQESLEISLQNIGMDSADLMIKWVGAQVSLPLKVAIKERVMNAIERTMKGPSNNDYYRAALYMQETGTDLERALEYIQKVTKSDKALFFQVYREALILGDLGRNQEAVTAGKRSLALSKEEGNKDFVRLSEQLISRFSS